MCFHKNKNGTFHLYNVSLFLANESCSDMDNNELDYNENDSENGEESCKLYNLTHFKFNSRNYIDIIVK